MFFMCYHLSIWSLRLLDSLLLLNDFNVNILSLCFILYSCKESPSGFSLNWWKKATFFVGLNSPSKVFYWVWGLILRIGLNFKRVVQFFGDYDNLGCGKLWCYVLCMDSAFAYILKVVVIMQIAIPLLCYKLVILVYYKLKLFDFALGLLLC